MTMVNDFLHQDEASLLADYCKSNLDLVHPDLGDQYNYRSLPLCIIDAVFSISARYSGTVSTVKRFCKYFKIELTSKTRPPNTSEQLSVHDFVKFYDQYNAETMSRLIYENRQRTSTRNGILKSEAVLRFSKVLQEYGGGYFQDMHKVLGNSKFEAAIKVIPGQSSELSLRYFYMLAGSDDYIKPDRMISRFLWSALHRSMSVQEMHDVIVSACRILAIEYPHLTPRTLDNLIWKHQRLY